jgi:hypothetical protein
VWHSVLGTNKMGENKYHNVGTVPKCDKTLKSTLPQIYTLSLNKYFNIYIFLNNK